MPYYVIYKTSDLWAHSPMCSAAKVLDW